MVVSIIGIDCATQPRKVGLARGNFEDGRVCIAEVGLPTSYPHLVDTIVEWVSSQSSALITLDAPLGWPAQMGKELVKHEAGMQLKSDADRLFHRDTDDFIYREYGKKPLEVGANLIARTEHAALRLLDEIRQRTGEEIPLAWEPGCLPGIYAIEVYPAVTLRAHKVKMDGYKSKDGQEARRAFIRELNKVVQLPADRYLLEKNNDVLDAAICVLAGADFLSGEVHQPANLNLAKKEGWIWVRKSE